MRKQQGGTIHVANVIEDDLEGRDTGLSKPQRFGLADLAASVLTCRSINTSELANVLPRQVKSDEERYRYIHRWLSNDKIKPDRVMQGFIPEILEMLFDSGQTAILMMDQSKITDGLECLMVSVRTGERALPVAWRVVETGGPIGFDIQRELLAKVLEMIPENMPVMLTADRFYGTSAMIGLCQQYGWQYRIRLKGNLILQHEGGELKTGEILTLGLSGVEHAELSNSAVCTNIGVLQEDEHEEAWIIAMDCKPTKARVLDYGMRWGIEALFSDLKTRGFGVAQTQIKNPDRIERLLLVLAIACFWAVSTGIAPERRRQQPSKKKPPEA